MNEMQEQTPVVVAPAQPAEINGVSADAGLVTTTPDAAPDMLQDAAQNLRMSIERLFSKEVLERNPLMLAFISSKMSVPLAVVAQHLGIGDSTGDFSALVSAIQDSNVCVATPDGGIRPTYKQQQHTVILRDVPSTTPADAILNILREKGCTGYKSIRSELNDTWFITFESEQDARDSIFAIRDATLDGKPIRARLKTESIAKSFYQAQLEQSQSQQWTNRPAQQYAPPHAHYQRYQQTRHRHNATPQFMHAGGGGGGGGRNNRNRSRRQYNTMPPVDSASHYHAMRMQAMWAAQFGAHGPAPPMVPLPMQQMAPNFDSAPRPAGPRRNNQHGAPRSSGASNRHFSNDFQRPQEVAHPPDGTTPLAPDAAAPSAPVTSPSSPAVTHSNGSKETTATNAVTDEARPRRNAENQQPRPRRTNGTQRKDSDTVSPRNNRSDGGKKQSGKRKPQQRKVDRKPRESAPEFTDADFPVLSAIKPSSSAPDLTSGYAEALKRGANGFSHNHAQAPRQQDRDTTESRPASITATDVDDEREAGEAEFQFFPTPADSTRVAENTVKANTVIENMENDTHRPVNDVSNAKDPAQPAPAVAQVADFESFPYMDSATPSTSRTTAWTGKKSFLEALRKHDQTV